MQVYTAVSLLHPLDHPAECNMPTPMPLDNLLGAIFIGIVLSTVYVYPDCSGGRLGAITVQSCLRQPVWCILPSNISILHTVLQER